MSKRHTRTKDNPKLIDFDGELVLDRESALKKKDPKQMRFKREE